MGASEVQQIEEEEEAERLSFLRELLADETFDAESDMYKAITEAIDQEDSSLVWNEIKELTECELCSNEIPASELISSIDNGHMCSYCEHMSSKDD